MDTETTNVLGEATTSQLHLVGKIDNEIYNIAYPNDCHQMLRLT